MRTKKPALERRGRHLLLSHTKRTLAHQRKFAVEALIASLALEVLRWASFLYLITDDYPSFVEAVGACIIKLQQDIREELRSLALTFLILLGGMLVMAVFRHTPVDIPLLKLCTVIALLGSGVSEFIRWAYSGCYCTKKCLIGTRLLLFWRAEYARQNAADARITPEST